MADAILGVEGFETDDSASVWEVIGYNFGGAPNPIRVEGARSGGKGLYYNGLGTYSSQSWLWTPTDHVIVGFAYRLDYLASDKYIFAIKGPGDVTHAEIFVNGQRCLGIHNNHPDTYAYTNKALDYGTWYYIEMRVKISGTTNGEIEIRVNGNPDPELLMTGVRVGSGSAPNWFANQFHCGQFRLSLDTDCIQSFDDFYVRDNSVAAGSLGFLGDVEIIGYGLQDDFSIEWTRSSGTKNYDMVDDTPAPDEDGTYVTANQVSGVKKDLYEVGDTAYQGEILCVQLVSRARKTSTHLWRFRNTMQVSGVDADAAKQHYLGYPNYETFPPDVFGRDPAGNPWTVNAFNAMKVGFLAEPMDNVP